MARENLQKTLRREREADARYAAHIDALIDALMAANKRRHQSRMLLAQLAGTGLVPVAHYSDNDDLCDHPCPEYLNGEDCRCTLANGGRPDGFGAALYDARLDASVPTYDELAADSGHVVSVHDTAAHRATDDERGTTG